MQQTKGFFLSFFLSFFPSVLVLFVCLSSISFDSFGGGWGEVRH